MKLFILFYLCTLRALNLREDAVKDGDCAEELLHLSKSTVEEYFVAPPGKDNLKKFNSGNYFNI